MREITNLSNSFFEELENFCLQQKENKLIFADYSNISNISFAETYRAFIDFDFSDLLIRNLFISHMEAIQLYSPTAAAYFPFLCLAARNKEYFLDHKSLEEITNKPDKSSILDILENLFYHSSFLNQEVASKIFEKNGFVSSFDIKKSNGFQNACVFNSGYFISGKIPRMISGNIDLRSNSLIDYSVIVHDGFIESISEINKILTLSNSNKEKFIILCHGSSEDVQYTCSVNKKMEKADVLIFHASQSFWQEQSNFVCEKLGYPKFGFETGILLSSVDSKELKKVNMLFNDAGIFIKSKDFGTNKEASTSFYLSDSFYEKRGFLEDQVNFMKSLLQQIAMCGISKNKDISKTLGIDINHLTGLNCKSHPSFPVFRAMNEATIFVNKIVNTGGVIRKELENG